MDSRRVLLLLPLAILLAPSTGPAQAGVVQRARRGDTTVVLSAAVGLWGKAVDAKEVLRIGDAPGGVWFGSVHAVAALPSGGVVVYDTKADHGPVGEIFSAEGKLLKSFARKGAGPGEVSLCNTDCVVITQDGRVAIHDFGQRVNYYTQGGAFQQSFVTHDGEGMLPQVLGGPGGSVYLKFAAVPYIRSPHSDAEETARFGFVRVNPDGAVVDTIRPPTSWVRTPPTSLLDPSTRWLPLPDGRLAVGGTDRLAVLLWGVHAAEPMLMMEVSSPRALFLPAERKQLLAVIKWHNTEGRSGSQAALPEQLPETKPAYRAIVADNDHRLWLQRFVTAVPVEPDPTPKTVVMRESGTPVPPRPTVNFAEPPVYAAFLTDGRYLGEVRFPMGVSHVSFAGDFAWALLKGKDDQDVVVKYRLPGGSVVRQPE